MQRAAVSCGLCLGRMDGMEPMLFAVVSCQKCFFLSFPSPPKIFLFSLHFIFFPCCASLHTSSGGGTRSRVREILKEAEHGGKTCVNPPEHEVCNTQPCTDPRFDRVSSTSSVHPKPMTRIIESSTNAWIHLFILPLLSCRSCSTESGSWN